MIYKRKYLQFNDLVFDGYDMIRDADGGVSFKESTESYPYRHGSYAAFKSSAALAESTTVSMTLKMQLKKVPCEMREYYVEFATGELMKPGKLWAIKNNTLMWAYAYITNWQETEGYEKDVFEVDVDFALYEGIWHKADTHKTFLTEYDTCAFLLCHGYQSRMSCKSTIAVETDCCTECGPDGKITINDTRLCCCDCENLTERDSLCYLEDSLQDFYGRCYGGYKITYDCQKGQDLFGDKYLGAKFCNKETCDTTLAGLFYSNTDLPTDGVTITLTGVINSPAITINGNTNVIKGDYEGTLVITPSGDVHHITDCCDTLLDPSVWDTIGESYGWEVHKGNNSFIVHGCCGLRCAYVEVDAITV